MFSLDHLLFRGFQDNDVEHLYSVRNDFRAQRSLQENLSYLVQKSTNNF